MLRRLWERLARLWRVEPCTVCGKPSVGFAADVGGKLVTKDADGKPVTRYYVTGTRAMCAKCLENERCRSS